MARVVEAMPEVAATDAYERFYPFFDGRPWELTQGQDFEKAASTRNALYRAAQKRGVSVKVMIRENGRKLFVQARR